MYTPIQHGTGGLPSPKDIRDYQWAVLGAGAIPFNWELGYDVESKLLAKVSLKDQGSSGSCGGQATGYYGEVLEAISTKSQEERSAKFIYAQTAVNQPGGGSFLRDNCEIAVKQGWAREVILSSYKLENRFDTSTGAPLGLQPVPPDEAFMTRKEDITPEVTADASKAKALSYAVVDRMSIDAVAQAVANNYGAIILIQGCNNGTWLSRCPQVGTADWNHFMYVGGAQLGQNIKLIDGKKYLRARQSWGNVGENGWQWISEDFFTQGRILEVRTIVFNDRPAQFIFTKNLGYGMRNGDVLQLQHRLVKEGFATFTPTGYFGWATFAAMVRYQKAHNILSTGFCGILTRSSLNVVQ